MKSTLKGHIEEQKREETVAAASLHGKEAFQVTCISLLRECSGLLPEELGEVDCPVKGVEDGQTDGIWMSLSSNV